MVPSPGDLAGTQRRGMGQFCPGQSRETRLYWEANEAAINEYEKLARSIAYPTWACYFKAISRNPEIFYLLPLVPKNSDMVVLDFDPRSNFCGLI